MKKLLFRSGEWILAVSAVALIVRCSGGTPLPSSPLATPTTTLTSPISISVLPTPPLVAVHSKILLSVVSTDAPDRATLETCDPDGSNCQHLAEVSPAPGSIAVSSNQRYVAFFNPDMASSGTLTVWDVQSGETKFQMPVPAEVSNSFRDAVPVRYLAWSPDDRNLAAVMNRDLYLLKVAQQDVQVLVHHREEQYSLAGVVMGSIGRPMWDADGQAILYDSFSPPEILSAGADHYTDVEYVDSSTGETRVLLEDAHVVQQQVTSDGQKLILQHRDGRFFLLDLTTLEVEETTLPPGAQEASLCDPQNHTCASIVSEQGQADLLRLLLVSQESQVRDVRLADLGVPASGCQFQSLLWSPDSNVLLTTVGCTQGVSLWSIRVSDLTVTHLVDRMGANAVALSCWFE